MTPHEILGVAPDATPTEIHNAYRHLAKQCHPDHGHPAEQFHTLTTARNAALQPRHIGQATYTRPTPPKPARWPLWLLAGLIVTPTVILCVVDPRAVALLIVLVLIAVVAVSVLTPLRPAPPPTTVRARGTAVVRAPGKGVSR